MSLGEFEDPCSVFDTFEHRYIGNQAFEQAMKNLEGRSQLVPDISEVETLMWGKAMGDGYVAPATSSMSIYTKEIPLRFGDLSGFAGDFSETPHELMTLLKNIKESLSDDKKGTWKEPRFLATRRQWAAVCDWLHNSRLAVLSKQSHDQVPLDGCVSAYLQTEDMALLNAAALDKLTTRYHSASPGYAPTRRELSEFEKLEDYASLASKNRSHFPSFAWKVYAGYYQEALVFAPQQAGRQIGIHSPRGESFMKPPA